MSENGNIEELVERAARQNFDRDRRQGIEIDCGDEMAETFEEMSMDEQQMYLSEARHLLETTGENYLPDYPDHEHIKNPLP